MYTPMTTKDIFGWLDRFNSYDLLEWYNYDINFHNVA